MQFCTIIDQKQTEIEFQGTFDFSVDVAVAGLGTAGSVAAIAAAEKGLSVIGIDPLCGMGGLGVFGCVWDYYFGSPGGRFEKFDTEIIDILNTEAFVRSEPKNKTDQYRCFPGVVREYVTEKAARSAGISLQFNSVVTGVLKESNKIIGLRFLNNGKEYNVQSNITIDSTGKVLLCKMAGLNVCSGRDWDERQMKYSKTAGILQNSLTRGVWTFCGNMENESMNAFSKAVIHANTKEPCLQSTYLENNRLIQEGTILGIRESDRILSEEDITLHDCTETDSPAFYALTPLDNVNHDLAFESKAQQDWHLICNLYHYCFSKGIPFRSLIPKGTDGLLVAGKGIGIDHDLCTGIRMKKEMQKCGEVAAEIAFLSVKHSFPVKEIPYNELRLNLINSGCLNIKQNVGIADLDYLTSGNCKPTRLLTERSELKAALSSSTPGFAIWSISNMKKEDVVPSLLEWQNEESNPLSGHSAIALGFLGEHAADKKLRQMITTIKEPDHFSNIPHQYPNALKAICLLGRQKDVQSIDLLFELLENKAENIVRIIHGENYGMSQEELIAQFFSFSVMSLMQIASKNQALTKTFKQKLKRMRDSGCYNDFKEMLDAVIQEN